MFGASGFIGSAVLEELKRHYGEYDLLCVGRRHVAGIAWTPFDLSTGSTAELASLLSAWRPTAVVNCAGATSGTAEQLEAGNVSTVATLVEAVLTGCPEATVVHLGSAAEYGPSEAYSVTEEGQMARPASDYGVSKLRATELLCRASRDRGLKAYILRLFNPVGAGSSADSVVGRAARQLSAASHQAGAKIVMGPLDAYRDFISTSEVARAVRLAAAVEVGQAFVEAIDSKAAREARVINIGSGVPRQVREVIGLLCQVAGFTGTIEERAVGSSRSATVSWQVADVSRARELLAWEPSPDLWASLEALWRTVLTESARRPQFV